MSERPALLVHVTLLFNGNKPDSMNANQRKFDGHIKLMSHQVTYNKMSHQKRNTEGKSGIVTDTWTYLIQQSKDFK